MSPRTIGSDIIAALEDAWAEVHARHPDVPERVVFITGAGHSGKRQVRGHWHPTRWAIEGGRLPEVFIGGERIAEGAVPVLTTLIHEACHGVAAVRKIQETSRQNRWHNRKFAALANELGLAVPALPHPAIGYSDTMMPDETRADYAETITALTDALKASIDGARVMAAAPIAGAGSPRPKHELRCECGAVQVQVTKTTAAALAGRVKCAECGDYLEETTS